MSFCRFLDATHRKVRGSQKSEELIFRGTQMSVRNFTPSNRCRDIAPGAVECVLSSQSVGRCEGVLSCGLWFHPVVMLSDCCSVHHASLSLSNTTSGQGEKFMNSECT